MSACSLAAHEKLEIVTNPSDQLPPSSPTVTLLKVQRGDDGNDGDKGCGSQPVSSCHDIAFVLLQVAASDDTTLASELGYVIESTSAQLFFSKEPIRPFASGQIQIPIIGSDDGSDDVRFELEVFTVDKAGNVSTQPTPLTVSSEGSGCQIGNSVPIGTLWCIVLAAPALSPQAAPSPLGLVARQRRLVRRAANAS